MYAKKGDVAIALTTFDKGIAAVPKCGSNYNAAARLLIKQNRVPEAKQKTRCVDQDRAKFRRGGNCERDFGNALA